MEQYNVAIFSFINRYNTKQRYLSFKEKKEQTTKSPLDIFFLGGIVGRLLLAKLSVGYTT